MSWFVVDVESDGPIPGMHSMVSFAVVKVTENAKTPYFASAVMQPISEVYVPEALAVSGITREKQLASTFTPEVTMARLDAFLEKASKGRPVFVSDNPAYDFAWMNYYFHRYLGKNPFGHSGRRIGDLYCGLVKDSFARWKYLRDTKHTHDPLDDARGNVEALLKMRAMGLKLPVT